MHEFVWRERTNVPPHFDEMVQAVHGDDGLPDLHPRQTRRGGGTGGPRFRHFLNEWFVSGVPHSRPTRMLDFNVFTFNSRVFPVPSRLLAKLGERVRIRIAK